MRQLVDAMLAARAVPPPPQPSLSALGSPAELPPRSAVLRHLVARLQCGLDPATQARLPSHHDRLPTTTTYLPTYHDHLPTTTTMSTPAATTFSRAPSVAGRVPRGVCEPAGCWC